MNLYLWLKIQSHWSTIISDLHVSTVLDGLLQKQVIHFDEYERISKQETENDKARKLLEILRYKDDQDYDNFLATLDEKKYGKIADAIRNAVVSNDSSKHDTEERKRKCPNVREGSAAKRISTYDQGIDKMRAALKSSYKSLSTMPISPFHDEDTVFIDEFYTDIVIKHHTEGGNSGNKQIEQYPYKHIFADSSTERIILTGLSGSGKSTFCKKIVSIWCREECDRKSMSVTEPGQMMPCKLECSADEDTLSQFSLVFYIYSPLMLKEASLIDILHQQCKRSESGQSSKSDYDYLSQILKEQPTNILIILDGIDEMGDETPLFLTELLGRKLNPNVIVLLAMRPWKIFKLKLKKGINYDLLVEINGFNENDALKFVRKVINHNIRHNAMKGPHPSPEEVMKMSLYGNVPLLLLFLVQIRCNDGYLPDKHKDLYQKILECLVKRCLSKKGNKYIPALTDQDDMNKKKDEFLELCMDSAYKVAYHFLLQGVSAIPEEALMNKLGNKDQLNALLDCGILSKQDAYSPLEQKNVSITFLHFSIHEHLASVYLENNEEAFQKFLESVETLNDVFKYENLFIFICGLNEHKGHIAFIKICQVCDKDPLVIQFRQGRDYDGHIKASLANLNGLYKKCLKEMGSQGIVEIPDIVSLEDEWYVTEMSRLRSSTTKSLYLCCVKLHRDDALDLSTMSNLTFLALCKVDMSKECSRSLCRSISGCIHMGTMKMEKMTLHDHVLDLSNLTNLTSLVLDNVTMSGDCSRSLCSSISGCCNLDRLQLVSIELYDGILDLSRLTKLTSLVLRNITISEECSRSLYGSISNCTCLERPQLELITIQK